MLCLLLTPLVGRLAKRYKLYDLPPSMREDAPDRNRRLEKPPRLLLGGLGVFITFCVLCVIYLRSFAILWWVLFPAGLLLIMGMIDDKNNIGFKTQLLIYVLAAVIFVMSPIDLNAINLPGINKVLDLATFDFSFQVLAIQFSLTLPGDLILVAWIVVIMMALKLNGGTDALLEGNAALTSLIIFLVSIRFSSDQSALMSIIFTGAMSAFIVYNFAPTMIGSGSTGKSIYGFIIATMAVASGTKFATTFMALSLPIVDMVFVIAQRVIDRKPTTILAISDVIFKGGDQRHLHHKLLHLGFSEQKIALFEYTVTLFIGIVGASLSGLNKLVFILLVPITLFSMILWITLEHKRRFLGALNPLGKPEKDAIPKPSTTKQQVSKPKDDTPEGKYSY